MDGLAVTERDVEQRGADRHALKVGFFSRSSRALPPNGG